jgi:hypothetical protein
MHTIAIVSDRIEITVAAKDFCRLRQGTDYTALNRRQGKVEMNIKSYSK